MRIRNVIFLVMAGLLAHGVLLPASARSQEPSPRMQFITHHPSEFHLQFHEGDLHRVVTKEVLRLAMHFPQVDAGGAKPSIRTSVYSFTETVEKVLPDGSAIIGASLDSFKTGINFGEGKNSENFFRFNSAEEWSITHELHDIKVLPRAQFLGHVIRFVMRPDGTISRFLNLDDFHGDAVGHGYAYDLVHAMLSLTDSLRMGQLLEYGMGGMAAINGPYTSPSTATEIPITRTVTASKEGNGKLKVHATYFDPPARIEYLEGIATPMGILTFYGGGLGEMTVSEGYLKHSFYQDTANVHLAVDIDTVPEEITRTVTTDVYPIQVLHASKITIREIHSHRAVYKDPNAGEFDSDSTESKNSTPPNEH
jgi:hypothetical protein